MTIFLPPLTWWAEKSVPQTAGPELVRQRVLESHTRQALDGRSSLERETHPLAND